MLAKQLGYEASEAEFLSRLKTLEAEGASGLFIGRDDDGTTVGWVHVQRSQISLLHDTLAEVRALVVDEACRGKGYGQLLLQHAEAWASAQGITRIFLRSNITRNDAHRFYQREGYSIMKTSHIFEKVRKR